MKTYGRTVTRADLVDLLVHHFSEADLRQLCLELDVPYDALRGSGTQEKAISLIGYCDGRNRLEQLLTAVADQRPHLAKMMEEVRAELGRNHTSNQRPVFHSGKMWGAVILGGVIFLLALLAINNGRGDIVGSEWVYRVIVWDAAAGTPLPRAAVTLAAGGSQAPQTVFTDVNGAAVFTLPASWRGRIASVTATIEGRQPLTRNITLEPEPPLEIILPSND